jgi:hypothetical protein
MKNVIYFLLTCFISTMAFMSALGSKYPFLLYAVGFGAWALFLWGYSKRSKRNGSRRSGEQLFQEYMRTQVQNTKR